MKKKPDIGMKRLEQGMPSPRYRDLFAAFFKIGLFTFGGGFAMIPLIQREMAEKRRWMEDGEIVDVLALAQTVPGAVAINAATLIGKRLAGNRGGLAATAGVILPSFAIITIIAAFFGRFQNEPLVQAAFHGLRPAVVALMAVAVWQVGKTSVRDALGWILAFLSTMLVVFFQVHILFVILGSALLGFFLYLLFPNKGKTVRTGGLE
jgi:chromate transporter